MTAMHHKIRPAIIFSTLLFVVVVIGLCWGRALAAPNFWNCVTNSNSGGGRTIVAIDNTYRSVQIMRSGGVIVEVQQFDPEAIEFTYQYDPPQGIKGRFRIFSDGTFSDYIEVANRSERGKCTKTDRPPG